ncbi:MAG: DUF1800 family protein [Vicinamibacterales bacterium]
MTTPPSIIHALRRSVARSKVHALHVAACALVALTVHTGTSYAAPARITVSPQNATIAVNSTKKFSAAVSFSPGTVTWEVNGIKGGNAQVGTISTSGLYTPPVVIPVANTLTIAARSTSRTSTVGSTKLTVVRITPSLTSVTPSPVVVGTYKETLSGTNFAPDSQGLVNGVAVKTTYMSASSLLVEGSVTAVGTLTFAVRQPGPGPVTGNSMSVSVVAASMPVSVTVAPTTTSLALGATQPFTATLTGTTNAGLMWSVNGVTGGSTTVGTISAAGVYVAPAALPASPTVTIQATSVASPTAFARATVTLLAPTMTINVVPTSAPVALGESQTFVATVTGASSTAVIWQVNGVTGGSASSGAISAAGTYTAPSVMPASSAVVVRAVSSVNSALVAQASLTLMDKTPTTSTSLSAARFLEQASFGPTPASLARVQQIGITPYLDEQLGMSATPIANLTGRGTRDLSEWMLFNYTRSPDQLRQRVSYALSQIVVTSAHKLVSADEMLPWLRILSDNAFGNYRDVLRQVSVSSSMGKYLDLANSMKAGLAGGANENYPRELMQLFTVGLVRLNQDGSPVLGSDGQPVPTYSQDTVREVARALTGWTYATAPGETPRTNNWEYFGAPLETRPTSHDTGAKSFLGCNVPAGQSVENDLDSVIDCLMAHPNTAPFIATRLIRSLVTSNPGPQYVKRVADVFAGTTTGVRGDLRATVRAILTDNEARQDAPSATQGRLKEPILHVAGFLRALNGGFSDASGLSYLFDNMAQFPLSPPSVFSWFSPLFHVPNSSLYGPEFQIYSPSEAVQKGNLFYGMLSGNLGGGYTIDLTPFQQYGDDMPRLVEAVNQTFHYGRMPTEMRQALVTAATPGYDAKARILTVVYLSALSGQYAVQY